MARPVPCCVASKVTGLPLVLAFSDEEGEQEVTEEEAEEDEGEEAEAEEEQEQEGHEEKEEGEVEDADNVGEGWPLNDEESAAEDSLALDPDLLFEPLEAKEPSRGRSVAVVSAPSSVPPPAAVLAPGCKKPHLSPRQHFFLAL